VGDVKFYRRVSSWTITGMLVSYILLGYLCYVFFNFFSFSLSNWLNWNEASSDIVPLISRILLYGFALLFIWSGILTIFLLMKSGCSITDSGLEVVKAAAVFPLYRKKTFLIPWNSIVKISRESSSSIMITYGESVSRSKECLHNAPVEGVSQELLDAIAGRSGKQVETSGEHMPGTVTKHYTVVFAYIVIGVILLLVARKMMNFALPAISGEADSAGIGSSIVAGIAVSSVLGIGFLLLGAMKLFKKEK